MATAIRKNRISGNDNGDASALIGAKGAKPSKAERIVIPKPDFRQFKVTLHGLTPYIMHKFSEKAKQKIQKKQGQEAEEAKGKRDPHAECWAAAYVLKGTAGKPGCVYGLPISQIKAAMVAACRYVNNFPMTQARGAIKIFGENDVNMAVLKSKPPTFREDAIRLPNKNLDMRYRPEFQDWSVTLIIRYLATTISAEMIVNLLSLAGECCGLGEMRPNATTGPGGNNGTFEVRTAD